MPVRDGIVQSLLDPPAKVVGEAKGWVELLDVPEKQHEFEDDWILALPFIRPEQSPDKDAVRIWHQVGKQFHENLDRFDWNGRLVLEIGAGRCWGVAELSRRGAHAVGLDILARKYLGLETADIWFAAEGLYFERVLGDMHRLPFQPESFDFVVTTSSLHHTDALEPVLDEIAGVLKAEGRAFFINEPVIANGQPKPDLSDSPEVRHGIIESRPTYSEWIAAFERAGLGVENVWFTGDMHVLLRKGPSVCDPLALVDHIPRYRGLRKSRRWRLIEHRWWMTYDRVKALVVKR
jgi:SAM-dependent methyltransferase